MPMSEVSTVKVLISPLPRSGHVTSQEPPALEPPERNALWSLEGALERTVVEPFSPEYASLLASARKALADRGGE